MPSGSLQSYLSKGLFSTAMFAQCQCSIAPASAVRRGAALDIDDERCCVCGAQLCLSTPILGVQKALVSEHIIQAFSQTHQSGSLALKVTLGGASIALRGMACAHFAALRYVSKIITQDLLDPALLQADDAESAALRGRCARACLLAPCVLSSALLPTPGRRRAALWAW